MKTIVGFVISSTERTFEGSGGSVTFYENFVDFGEGGVVVNSAERLSMGDVLFTVVRKSSRDFTPRLKVYDEASGSSALD